jgi:xylose dehydrogenase (NAD/NADP)
MTAPVRWGFLGAGMIARVVGAATRDADGAVLHAAAARDLERAQGLLPEVAYADYAALLADDDVEAVYVSLTNDQHLPWTLRALEAGKHVLCEKPLALTVGEVDRMAAAAAAADRLCVEASWYRWHPRVRLAQSRLADLGTVRHVAAGFRFDGSLDGNYRLEVGRGGGALYDVGCYAVSACLWAVGQGAPEDVVARSQVGPTGVDLDTRAVLRWADDTEAEVHVGMTGADGQWLVITGDRGEIELRDQPYTSWGDATELWVSDGTGTERVPVPAVNAYQLMVEEVSSAIRGGTGWVLPLAESRQTAAVLDAARTSAGQGGQPASLS